MTDQELLGLAAKAASVEIDRSPYNGGGHGSTGFDVAGNVVLDWHNGVTWNPLTDDGDALRLAVKLKFDLAIEGRVILVHNGAGVFEEQAQDFGGDANAATRRAIVRAAAEIGKEKAPDLSTRG